MRMCIVCEWGELRDWLRSDEYDGWLWTRFPRAFTGDAIDILSGEAADNSPDVWNRRYSKEHLIQNLLGTIVQIDTMETILYRGN